jgi:3-oxoacyl-[acyl-carrier-protein] synthase III
MSFGILGTGYCVPDEVRTNEWWPRSFVERFEERARGDVTTPEVVLARAKDEDQRIQLEEMLPTIGDPFRGSRERRIAPDGTHCSDLEVEAARRALTAAGVAPSELRFIIEYSWPPDRPVPNNASLVQHRLEAYEAVALEVDSACCSFLSGLRVAEALLRDGGGYALVVAGVLFSRTQDWDDPSGVGIGDGAGAAVVGPVRDGLGFLAHAQRTYGSHWNGVCCAPKDDRQLWYEGGAKLVAHSKDLALGHEIVLQTGRWAREAVESLTSAAGVRPADVTHFYAHQPASFFNPTCRRAAGLAHTTTLETFDRFASMGSANIPVNLTEAQAAGQLSDGDLVVLYACGMGLHWAASLLRWSATGPRR